jgi:hypothetical protein
VTALVATGKGNSSPKKVATLPKGNSAADFVVMKLERRSDRVVARGALALGAPMETAFLSGVLVLLFQYLCLF